MSDTTKLVIPPSKRDHLRGPLSAPVLLVEYGDYECPHCVEAHSVVKALREELGEGLGFAFRNFPQVTVHEHAQPAAEAAEAAGAQGSFWEMHDLLFGNPDALAEEDLIAYAASLHLEMPRFASELARHSHSPRVHEDILSGIRSGVSATPTFFVNGVRHDGRHDLDSLRSAIEAAATRRARAASG
jgi:protein-disulfide isomerase